MSIRKQINPAELKSMQFFKDLAEEDLAGISEIIQIQEYLMSDVIMAENSIADTFCIIKSGKVQISKKLDDDSEMIFDTQETGAFFGEMALLDEGLRSATVRAVEHCEIFEISKKSFERLLQTSPLLGYKLMKEMSKRLRETGNLLVSHLKRKNAQLSKAYKDTISAVVNALDARDPYTKGHSLRVTLYSVAIARSMGIAEEDLFILEIGSLLHDVGKMALPDSILYKPDALTEEEFWEVKKHPATGGRILHDISYLEKAIPVLMYHHERYDGGGYPEAIKEKDIPLVGRIAAVADAFDAMTSDRPYRIRISFEEAFGELEKGKGTQFDPEIVDHFKSIWLQEGLEEQVRELM